MLGSLLLGRAKRSPSHLGGAKTGSLVRRGCAIVLVRRDCAIVFGTSRLRNTIWYIAVAQYFTLYGTFAALRNSLPSLVGKKGLLRLLATAASVTGYF